MSVQNITLSNLDISDRDVVEISPPPGFSVQENNRSWSEIVRNADTPMARYASVDRDSRNRNNAGVAENIFENDAIVCFEVCRSLKILS